MSCFDTQMQEEIIALRKQMFFATRNLSPVPRFVNATVPDTLTACLLLHLPSLRQLNQTGFIVKRINDRTANAGVHESELLARSSALSAAAAIP